MASGIEVRDSQGNVIFNAGNRLFKVLTTTTAGGGGSFTNSMIGANVVGVNVQISDPGKKPPTTHVSGNTVSWDFSGSGGGSPDTEARLQILAF